MLVIGLCLVLPISSGSYPECREREKVGWILFIRDPAQGKVCLPKLECNVEGCTETGSICRKVLKPRSDIWSRVALMENIINQVQLQEEKRVSGEVGGR